MSFIGLMSEINKKGRRFDAALNEVQSVRPPLSAEIFQFHFMDSRGDLRLCVVWRRGRDLNPGHGLDRPA